VPNEGIRATVIGASQYTTQVSGGTIFVDPLETLPLRNVPVIAPALPLDGEAVEPDAVRTSIRRALDQLELTAADGPVALFVPWRGVASFSRLDSFCRGVLAGMAPVLSHDRPLILAGDGDVGGLLGMHLKAELGHTGSVVSIDGLELKPFDFIDIGRVLRDSGAAPVVIKSLVFPADAALGRPLRGLSTRS
jgi:ethanolamine utilization protein EutA